MSEVKKIKKKSLFIYIIFFYFFFTSSIIYDTNFNQLFLKFIQILKLSL